MKHSYRDPDYAFGQMMLTLRTAIGLTQTALADYLDVSRRTIGDWEAGNKYPKPEHLKQFISLSMRQKVFTAGREAEEIRGLWKAARQRVLIDDAWLASLTPPSSTLERLPIPVPSLVSDPRMKEERSYGFPFQPTSFVGRGAELADIARILRDPACRLLTLLGSGGVGKTRLAQEAAASHLQAYADGAAFVSLAAVGSPNQIVSAIADTLKLSIGSEDDPAAHLLAYLRERHLLLVFDNFEHLLDGTALVYDILERAPRVTVLITSRERLNMRAEWLFDVQGLSYPPANTSFSAASLTPYSAVQLFIQRAVQVQPDFPLNEASLTMIVHLCQRVSGLPLAIELAAAGLRQRSIAEIDHDISSNLDRLATTLRDVPARHRSLRAVFDHSWNLMSEIERAAFKQLGVFRGGFTADAAEQVAGASMSVLLALIDKSLVRQEKPSTQAVKLPRTFLLEPIREYTLQKLDVAELEALRRTHALYFLMLAESAQAKWETPDVEATRVALDHELDNMRAALQWAISGGDAMIGLRLAEALVRYWRNRVYLDEARQWLEALLALNEHQTDLNALGVRMRTTYATAMIYADRRDYTNAGILFEKSRALRHALGAGGDETTMRINQAQQARNAGNYRLATSLLEESVSIYRAVGDLGTFTSGGYGFVLYFLAHMLREQGEYDRARAWYLECREFHLAAGDREGAAQGLLGLSDVARDVGDATEVRRCGNEALAIYREFGTQWAIGFCINNLAMAAYLEGELDEAFALSSESVGMFRAQKSPGSIAEVLVTLGAVMAARGDIDGAYDALVESIRLASETSPRLLIAAALEGLGCVMSARDDVDQAIQFLATSTIMRDQMGTPLRPADQPTHDRALNQVRVMLGEVGFNQAWSAAKVVPLEQVLSRVSANTAA